jgi:cyclophilin family peptidyl-prolyl cis-trans isomerase
VRQILPPFFNVSFHGLPIAAMKSFRTLLTPLVVILLCLAAASAPAQEKAGEKAAKAQPRVDPKQARSEFEKVYAQWKDLLTQLAELQGKFEKSNPREKAAIEKDYTALVEKGNKLSAQLKSATETAFQTDPTDKEVWRLLAIMAISAYNEDNHEEAYRLSRMLLDKNLDVPRMSYYAARAAMGVNRFEEIPELMQAAMKEQPENEEIRTFLAEARQYAQLWQREQEIREAEAQANNLPRVKLQTTQGNIVIELFEDQAPNTVANIISLVEKGFYDGVKFHRVIQGFMAQGGDPTGTGGGGPGYTIKDEVNRSDARMHFRGSLSMAKTEAPDSGGSQFFLCFRPTPHLNGKHTVFGRVIEGFEVLSKLKRVQPSPSGVSPPDADKIVKATVIRKRDHEYKPQTLPDK